jgi:hypothetical protein
MYIAHTYKEINKVVLIVCIYIYHAIALINLCSRKYVSFVIDEYGIYQEVIE